MRAPSASSTPPCSSVTLYVQVRAPFSFLASKRSLYDRLLAKNGWGLSRTWRSGGAEEDQPQVVLGMTDFPPGFFDRADESDDAGFYAPPRLVTHIDDDAIAAVGVLYEELGIDGEVLDLMSSWVSHFRTPPAHLRVLGMNRRELEANPVAAEVIVHDLNAEPVLPLSDESVDDAVCCVSVDYLTQPVEVFRDVARVLRPGGRFVCTFSNRLFPTKAVRGWLSTGDDEHCAIVTEYFRQSRVFGPATVARRTPVDHRGDPLFAVWAQRL